MPKIYRKIKRSIKLDRVAILGALVISPIILVIILALNIFNKKEITASNKCHRELTIDLVLGNFTTVKNTVNKNQLICYYFNVLNNDKIVLFSKNKVILRTPDNHQNIVQGSSNLNLSSAGIYSIVITTDQETEDYLFTLKLENNQILKKNQLKIVDKFSYKQENTNQESTNEALQPTYNVVTPPSFKPNSKLQSIVNDVVSLVASKGLPIDRLSVSLINLENSDCCAYAQYLDQELRFPASVAKLFWMVYLYGQYETKRLPEGAVPYKNLVKMIQDSDNESASLIVDTISQTKSGESLPPDEIEQWVQKRLAMNSFFEKANYQQINISQKLFPTDYQKNDAPAGRDLQIRGSNESNPFRNYTTTYNVARLLLEIDQGKAISEKYSNSMKLLLKRSLRRRVWKKQEFNAIEGFLGEYLPENAYFASKMGWNFNTRNDAAIIGSPDGKHKYILVIFGDDPSFYKDKKLFPELSRLVYERMTN